MDNIINKPINADCFDIFPKIKDNSIDLIFCDLPYGTTNLNWDKNIPLNDYIIVNKRGKNIVMYKDEFILYNSLYSNESAKYWLDYFNENKTLGLWTHYNRIIKDNGAILLYGQTPFDKSLGNSNINLLRYEWIWEKTQATGHLNSRKMPMKAHESILVFYKKLPTYNYMKTYGHIKKVSSAKNRASCIERRNNTNNIYNNEYADKVSDYSSTERYPRSVLKFATDKQKSTIHKTQKPLKLTEYMIKTYSNENDLVLDNCAGSFVLAEACNNLNRNWICIEKDKPSYEKAIKERKLYEFKK